jgi:sugar transferase (PEP-CTERM system associated)
LRSNLTEGSAALVPCPPVTTSGWDDFPRLVWPETPSASRRAWTGALGHTLLETPWPIWCLFDLLVVTLGVYLGYRTFVWTPEGAWLHIGWVQTSGIQTLAFMICGLVFGLYEQQTLLRGSRIVARSLLSTLSAAVLAYVVVYLFMYQMHSRRVLFLAASVYLGIAPAVRLLVCAWVQNCGRTFLIVGTDARSRLPIPSHCDGLSRRYRLAGYITLNPLEIGREICGRRVLGGLDDLEDICRQQNIREIVVGPGAAHDSQALRRALGCLKLGCRVTNLSTFYEQVLSEVPLNHLEPDWFLFADLKHYRESQLIIKRVFDVFSSAVGLLLTLPFWPLIALLIKLDSEGPVFYHQIRVGLNGRTFRLHKFRTMCVTAEANGHAWASLDDPRVTRVGRYLRKARLDELPQLWNILVGDMSIVGPRPERPEFVEQLSRQIDFYNERHLIKPGLTGWAQINYPYGASVEDARRKLQLDLWYIKHMSLELDLFILLRTPGTVFLGSR